MQRHVPLKRKTPLAAALAIGCVGAALLFLTSGRMLLGGLLLLPPLAYAVHRTLRPQERSLEKARAHMAVLSTAGFSAHDTWEGEAVLAVDRRRMRLAVADAHSANIHPLWRVAGLRAEDGAPGKADLVLEIAMESAGTGAGTGTEDGAGAESPGAPRAVRLPGFAPREAAQAAALVTRLAQEARAAEAAATTSAPDSAV
ncbi:MAG: hypothetical protein H0S85_14805 [Desulfovibrionaceae bacterium]|jgi:hypothetical protein|nr:hypothetical protein [Desulfovibrionaceae bacterium]